MKSMHKTIHYIQMHEHPVKAVIATIFGTFFGGQVLLSSPPAYGSSLLILIEALFKAFMVGGAAWFGQTIAQWCKKKIVSWYKLYKSKKNYNAGRNYNDQYQP